MKFAQLKKSTPKWHMLICLPSAIHGLLFRPPLQVLPLTSGESFRPPDLKRIEDIVVEHHKQLLEEYNGYFGTDSR